MTLKNLENRGNTVNSSPISPEDDYSWALDITRKFSLFSDRFLKFSKF